MTSLGQQSVQRYGKLKIIGQGAYGTVWKCIDKVTGGMVAMKKSTFKKKQGISSSILREISVLKTLKHQNVIPLLTVLTQDENQHQAAICLMFPFIDEDLARYMKRRGELPTATVKVTLANIQNLMWKLTQGCRYLHSRHVIHRDLKPQNILISDTEQLYIADLGLARSIDPILHQMSRQIQTLWYRAPEVLLGEKKYTWGVDVWSLGCILYELATNKILFRSDSEIDTIFRIFLLLGTPLIEEYPQISKLEFFKPSFPRFPKTILTCDRLDKHGNDLLNKMLQINPDKRINLVEILQHPFFDSVL